MINEDEKGTTLTVTVSKFPAYLTPTFLGKGTLDFKIHKFFSLNGLFFFFFGLDSFRLKEKLSRWRREFLHMPPFPYVFPYY